MKYILASDPIESGGSPSPVPVIDTGHWSAARRDDEPESAARVPTDNYQQYFGAASLGPGLLLSYEFSFVIRTYLSLLHS